MKNHCVLYLDDEEDNLFVFKSSFRHEFNVITTTSVLEAMNFLRNVPIQVVIADYKMPEKNGVDFLKDVYVKFPEVKRILLTAFSDSEIIIKSVNDAQIFSYVKKPWSKVEIRSIINRAIETFELKSQNNQLLQDLIQANEELLKVNQEVHALKQQIEQENEYLRAEIDHDHPATLIIGSSNNIKETVSKAEFVARMSTTVLILGETGTGKELIARTIHKFSPRSNKPIVKLNCAALPINLVESELFGYEKGAFTGAMHRKPGLFEIADGGTIFLDEIGEVPIEVQAKLLRVLQDGEYYQVGGLKPKTVDVRIIAATNRDLIKAIEKGTFRSDLYYRLNVFPIRVPALRERLEDLMPLVNHFVEKFQRKLGIKISRIPDKTERTLRNHTWPGNIRELESVIERSVILCTNGVLDLTDWSINGYLPPPVTLDAEEQNLSLSEWEKRYIVGVLHKCNWKISGKGGAAEILQLNHNTLRSKMIKLGIRF